MSRGYHVWVHREANEETQRIPRRNKRKIVVPNIKQALFDSRSKVQLAPGTELRQYPIDDAWLLRKHKDNLADFTDVEPAEKEYMQEWDAFVLQKHLSSPQFLPRALAAFVKEKAGWIVSNRSRSDEFSKHVSMLLARRVISEAAVVEVTQRITEARGAHREAAAAPVPVAEPKFRPKSAAGCGECGEPVPVPLMLICANRVCFFLSFLIAVLGFSADCHGRSNARAGCTTPDVWRMARTCWTMAESGPANAARLILREPTGRGESRASRAAVS